MNPVAQLVFLVAIAIAIAGVALILFPGVAKRWSDAHDLDPYRIKPKPPDALRLKSKGSFRAMGVGLIVVAALAAYYGFTIH
jgi:hypothetical protein